MLERDRNKIGNKRIETFIINLFEIIFYLHYNDNTMKFEIIYRSNYDKNLQLNYTYTDVRIKIVLKLWINIPRSTYM